MLEMFYCKLYAGLMTVILISYIHHWMNIGIWSYEFFHLFGIKYSFPPSVLTAINQPITISEYILYESKLHIQLSSSVGRKVL